MLLCSRATVASFLLAYGAEHLSKKYGAKFVGRTLLSVATTLPEIAIVIYAALRRKPRHGNRAGLGSNLLMMTLGLSILLLIATARLSKAPSKVWMLPHSSSTTRYSCSQLRSSVQALFIDGYNFIDGFIFAAHVWSLPCDGLNGDES